jgi:pimeloyl-ACP methyl ester carboxylesterase
MNDVTVIAVHGNGGGGERFARAAATMPAGVALRAITLPGFSTMPLDPTLRTVSDYADRLGQMVSASGPEPVVLGHGIGGSIALDLASRHPELLGGLILHAPVGAHLDTRLFPRLMATGPARAAVKRAIVARPLRPLWRRAFFPTGAPKADLDQFFEGYRHCAAFGQMFDLITPAWFEGVEAVRDVPAVLAWGERDRVLRSAQVDAMRTKVPDADVVIWPGWDHFPMIEQPQEYAGAVAFLAQRLVGR